MNVHSCFSLKLLMFCTLIFFFSPHKMLQWLRMHSVSHLMTAKTGSSSLSDPEQDEDSVENGWMEHALRKDLLPPTGQYVQSGSNVLLDQKQISEISHLKTSTVLPSVKRSWHSQQTCSIQCSLSKISGTTGQCSAQIPQNRKNQISATGKQKKRICKLWKCHHSE